MPFLPIGNKPANRPAFAVVHRAAADSRLWRNALLVNGVAGDGHAACDIDSLRLAALPTLAAGRGGVEVVHDGFVGGHGLIERMAGNGFICPSIALYRF